MPNECGKIPHSKLLVKIRETNGNTLLPGHPAGTSGRVTTKCVYGLNKTLGFNENSYDAASLLSTALRWDVVADGLVSELMNGGQV